MFDVDKKAAIITGSARGLGKDFAIRLLRSGAKVCLSDVNQEDGGKTLAELQDKFGPNRVHFVPCNVSVDQDWVKLWDEAEQKLGPISLLINNAGIRASSPWKANLDVNLYGVGLGVEMGIKRMGKLNGGQGGRIINMGSMSGFNPFGVDFAPWVGYAMAKWGVVGLTKGFAAAQPDLFNTQGIKCYAICPLATRTQLLTEKDIWNVENLRQMRLLEVPEVTNVMEQALRLDQNGACLSVVPDAPTMDVPNLGPFFLKSLVTSGRVMKALGLEVDWLNPFVPILLVFLAIFMATAIVCQVFV